MLECQSPHQRWACSFALCVLDTCAKILLHACGLLVSDRSDAFITLYTFPESVLIFVTEHEDSFQGKIGLVLASAVEDFLLCWSRSKALTIIKSQIAEVNWQ